MRTFLPQIVYNPGAGGGPAPLQGLRGVAVTVYRDAALTQLETDLQLAAGSIPAPDGRVLVDATSRTPRLQVPGGDEVPTVLYAKPDGSSLATPLFSNAEEALAQLEADLLDFQGYAKGLFLTPSVVAPYPTGVVATDTANLLAAIAATPEAGLLHLPCSPLGLRYRVNQALVIDKHMSVYGEALSATHRGTSQGGNSSYPNSPGMVGVVIEQTAAATDGFRLTGAGKTVNLKNLGVYFPPSVAGNTGHGFDATTTVVTGGFPDLGAMEFTWENLQVYGHDGNHYGFVWTNPLLGSTTNLRAYGGGGFYTVGNHATINAGNLVHIHPYVAVQNTGTAAGFAHFARTNGPNNGEIGLLTYIRPQAMLSDAALAAQDAGQYTWDDMKGPGTPRSVLVLSADFESQGNPVRFGTGTQILGHYITGSKGRSSTNVAFGDMAMPVPAAAASELTAIGYQALGKVTTAGSSTAVGAYALSEATTGGGVNAALGVRALGAVTTGSGNTAVGWHAGYAPNGNAANGTTTGALNTFLGRQSGAIAATVNGATAIGNGATAGASAVSLGDGAIAGNTRAIAIGNGASAAGSNSIAIGGGASATVGGTIAIGRDSAGTPASATTQDEAVIGTALTTLRLPGKARIQTLPAFAAGDKYVVADASGNLHLSALGPAS